MIDGNTLKKVGQYTMIVGGCLTVAMAVIGTIALDLVFIAALAKQAKERNWGGMVLTGYLWHFVSGKTHPLILLLLSPFTTIAAMGLAIMLDVGYMAWWLAGGWAVAVGILVLGYGLYKLGQYLNNEQPKFRPDPEPQYDVETGVQAVDCHAESDDYLGSFLNQFSIFREEIPLYPVVDARVVDGNVTGNLPHAVPIRGY